MMKRARGVYKLKPGDMVKFTYFSFASGATPKVGEVVCSSGDGRYQVRDETGRVLSLFEAVLRRLSPLELLALQAE